MGYTEDMINKGLEHWPLVGVIAFGAYWMTKNVLPKIVKEQVHDVLKNGGGETIRAIVKEENEFQEMSFKRMLKETIAEHEQVEEAKVSAALLRTKADIEQGGTNLSRELQAQLKEHERRLEVLESRESYASERNRHTARNRG